MKRLLLPIFTFLSFSSCKERLNEVTVGRDDVKVSKYEISEISTVHDVIEVKKGYSVIKVMEANSHGFTDIIISQDTVIIKYMPTVV